MHVKTPGKMLMEDEEEGKLQAEEKEPEAISTKRPSAFFGSQPAKVGDRATKAAPVHARSTVSRDRVYCVYSCVRAFAGCTWAMPSFSVEDTVDAVNLPLEKGVRSSCLKGGEAFASNSG